MANKLDKYKGCLIGGAAGDALGYAVEFFEASQIFRRYGENGITKYELTNGVAQISDDTQMTLFTADALCWAEHENAERGSSLPFISCIKHNYKAWYVTQTRQYPLPKESNPSHIMTFPELYSRRAPGNTCLSVIEGNCFGSVNEPINRSKGCGGVMRVAPVGLFFGKNYPIEDVDMLAAEAAALTHGHSLGYIPAAALAHIIHLIVHQDGILLKSAVSDMIASIKQQFSFDEHISEFTNIVDKAIMLSSNYEIDDLDAIRMLGKGWVAEETLAIALYCALKYESNFEKALIAAVNHDGDSDSTGALTGNILGAYLGLSKLPQRFIDNLELKNYILELAENLYTKANKQQ